MLSLSARLLLAAFLFGLPLVGCSAQAQDSLRVDRPPSGQLSAERLAQVASDIRSLLAQPLASDADQAREGFFQWLQASPDVSVYACANFLYPLAQTESRHSVKLVIFQLLASAAHTIENPDANPVEITTAGLRGSLDAYNVIVATEGEDARDPFMDFVASMAPREDKLEGYVRATLSGC